MQNKLTLEQDKTGAGINPFGFHSTKENPADNVMTIKLNTDITTLKLKAFKQSLGESIRYLFYVSFAIVKGDVKRPDDMFDTSTRLFETLSPILQTIIPSESRGLKTDLAIGMVNLFFEVISSLKNLDAIKKANSIVLALQGSYGKIDVEVLKDITKAFAQRFKSQISNMSLSISTNGKLRLHERDGIVVFANVIAKRVGTHLMQGKSEYVDDGNLAILSECIQKKFSEPQNVKARLKTPTLDRCIMATYKEIDGYDTLIEFDSLVKGEYSTFAAGDILTQTGIRDIKNPGLVCERKDNFNPLLGYINATAGEAKLREYEPFLSVYNKNTHSNLSMK